ncbi:hypothetical protein [Pseudomonas sp. URMO17WK12:I12]|jgi:hypothetical protein|uniref:hypothetical protein n=1 Tax=Pseudomonas sp. URMO17WK12:I12 TaxID=1259797 RepID=UPI00048126A5|nr:hypothetical protein [Pseudomonas sp. URMO17WK12:I12]
MKFEPDVSILPGLLFVFDIDYPHEESVLDEICSTDVNDPIALSRIMDLVLKPTYQRFLEDEQQWHVNTLRHFLDKGESFKSVLEKRSFLFSDEVVDGREFMRILYLCLMRYQREESK